MAAPGLPAPAMLDSANAASTPVDPKSFAEALIGEIARGSTAAHAYSSHVGATRDALADAAHFLCLLHGNQPDVAELAAIELDSAAIDTPLDVISWIREISRAFMPDRLWLAQLTALAGAPAPSFGLTSAEHIARAQRDAMLTLARSGRAGCAFGATLGFALDWPAIRLVLDEAAQKHLSTDPLPPLAFPPVTRLVPMITAMATTEGVRRALRFGAMQMLSLHQGLWSLLESRSAAGLS